MTISESVVSLLQQKGLWGPFGSPGRVELLKLRPDLFASDVLAIHLHDAQKEIVAHPAQYKIGACGRRFGKTKMASVLAIHLALVGNARFSPPTTQIITAPTEDQTTVMGEEIERLLRTPFLNQFIASTTHSPFFDIQLTNGSLILCRSASHNGAYLRGRGAHRVFVDEAAFVSDSVINSVIMPMLADVDGELILISTPFGFNHFYDFFKKGLHPPPPSPYQSFQFPTSANPLITPDFIALMKTKLPDAVFRAEFLADFVDSVSTVFKTSLITACALGGEEDPLPSHSYIIGFDPARGHDRSAVIVLDISDPIARVVKITSLSGRDYVEQAHRVRSFSSSYNNARVIIDSTNNSSLADLLSSLNVRNQRIVFTQSVKAQMISDLVIAMESNSVTFPPDPDLLKELGDYQYSLTKTGTIRYNAPDREGFYDDLVTALALAYLGAGRSEPVSEYYKSLSGNEKEKNKEPSTQSLRLPDGTVSRWGF